MSQATLDRFGRIVIPKDVRQRHGWRPGMPLELRDGPHGLEVLTGSAPTTPAGWAWVDGLLVCTASGDPGDLVALRDRLDGERDHQLGGLR